jgi:uncharacterized protein (TIGR02246 family)
MDIKSMTNRKIRIFYKSIIISSLLSCLNYTYALSKKDEISIKSTINEYVIAWNQSDASKFSEAFSTDADFVNIFGQRFKGKSEIRERHRMIFKTFLKNSKLEISELNMKSISKNVVIAHVSWHITGFKDKDVPSPQNHPSEDQNGIFTHVFMKENGKWLIVGSQNTLQRQSPK